MLNGVHHINFLVRDLDAAAARYSDALGMRFGPDERLAERGVRLRRCRVGATWIVLVTPERAGTAPARWLEEKGEGVFLVSFGVDSLDRALARLESVGLAGAGEPRRGLDDWRVVDLDPRDFGGVPVQLTAEGPWHG